MRVKSGNNRRKRHKQLKKDAKGMGKTRRSSPRKAREALLKAETHADRHRKERKRDFRKLWISRINAAVRQYGLSYSKFIHLLKENNIKLNRKMLSELAVQSPNSFEKIVNKIKK